MKDQSHYWRRNETATSIDLVVDDPLLISDTYITTVVSPFQYQILDKKSKAFKEIGDTTFPFGDPSKTIRIGNRDMTIVAQITNNTDPNVHEKIKSSFRAAAAQNKVVGNGSVLESLSPELLAQCSGLCFSSSCCCANTRPPFPEEIPYRPAPPVPPGGFDRELDPREIPCGWYRVVYQCECWSTLLITKHCPGDGGNGITLADEYIPLFDEEFDISPDPSWDSPRIPDYWHDQGIPDGGVIVAAETTQNRVVCEVREPSTGCTYFIEQIRFCQTASSVTFTPGCRGVPGQRIPIVNQIDTELTPLITATNSSSGILTPGTL